MIPKTVRKVAEHFVNVLKYNPELSDDMKVLSLELSLEQLIADVRRECEADIKKKQNSAVIVDSRPSDIPLLHDLMIADQARRGVLN